MVLRLIVGDDPILVGEAISASVEELVGDGDRSLMLELLTETDYRNDDGDWESAKVLDAARTPPFLTERRVVVGRHLSRFSRKDDYGPIIELLGEPLETTDLVLVWERGRRAEGRSHASTAQSAQGGGRTRRCRSSPDLGTKGKGAATGCAISSRRAR